MHPPPPLEILSGTIQEGEPDGKEVKYLLLL